MKNKKVILIVFALVILTSCSNYENEKNKNQIEVENIMEIDAVIKDINLDEDTILVEGLGENNPIGNLSNINIKDAAIVYKDKNIKKKDLDKGDIISFVPGGIKESYPSQTNTRKITILKRYKKEENNIDVDNKKEIIIKELADKIEIRSQGEDFLNLSLIALSYNSSNNQLDERETLKYIENIEEGEKVIWDVTYSEGIPSMKIKWIMDDGSSGEYILSYNGKDGTSKEPLHLPINYKEIEKNDSTEKNDLEVELYYIVFEENDSYLIQEREKISKVDEIAKLTLATLRERKPDTENAKSPIPYETIINSITINDKIAYVDFSHNIADYEFGSSGEILQVQAIVNTLTQFPSIEGVIFKIEGNEDIEIWLAHIGNINKPWTRNLSQIR